MQIRLNKIVLCLQMTALEPFHTCEALRTWPPHRKTINHKATVLKRVEFIPRVHFYNVRLLNLGSVYRGHPWQCSNGTCDTCHATVPPPMEVHAARPVVHSTPDVPNGTAGCLTALRGVSQDKSDGRFRVRINFCAKRIYCGK